jgi:hypothetical protein
MTEPQIDVSRLKKHDIKVPTLRMKVAHLTMKQFAVLRQVDL